MTQRITIDPITRLEGHGKIEIFLDDDGNVSNAYLQIPELRGFEAFCVGRPAEEMPRITPRICGVCPTSHHMASTRALDALYGVEPPEAAHRIRELLYNLFMFEDHTLHFYFLGGPDFIVGPDAPPGQRNILGVIDKVGLDVGKKVIAIRKEARSLIEAIGGKVIHPVFGLPGGISKPLSKEIVDRLRAVSSDFVDFAAFSLQAFSEIVLENKSYLEMIASDAFLHRTHYMGLVDENNRVNFYRGAVRVVDQEGNQLARFQPEEYLDHIAEHVEPWSYVKFPYLKAKGWKGFVDGPDSGVYRVAPLARLNASEGMATFRAQEHYEKMYTTLGGKPSHSTLAFHWARLIEALQAAEVVHALSHDPDIGNPEVRNLPTGIPSEGVGIVEAPRGTLIHHYRSDGNGILNFVNLLVATVHNAAPIQMSIRKAAKEMIRGGKVNDGLLNRVEMAFRAYDPCHACATHSLPGEMPLVVAIRDSGGEIIETRHRGLELPDPV